MLNILMRLTGMGKAELIMNLIIIVGIVITLGLMWYFGKKKQVKLALLVLVKAAQEKFKQGENDAKFQYVYNKLYNAVPWIVRFIFVMNKDTIQKWINQALIYLEHQLQEGSVDRNITIKQALELYHDKLCVTQNEASGDPYSVTNKQITELKNETVKQIFASVNTDFKKNTAASLGFKWFF